MRARTCAALCIVLAAVSVSDAHASEKCRYSGTTDYDGHAAITTDVSATGGITRVDAALTFEAHEMLWFQIRYLAQEISVWRDGKLQSVAVNNRYLSGDHIVRQQWDRFDRTPDGLLAHRVQAKTLADFSRLHPGFVKHWDPAAFGQPWLGDYQAARPERRTDLDLATTTPRADAVRTPLALAFYWVRVLSRSVQDVPVFLPGFKEDRLVAVKMIPAEWQDGTKWQIPLANSWFSRWPPSSATAWTTSDGKLAQLALDLHGSRGSAAGLFRLDGCSGRATDPD